ncbi:hypothetical protein AeRB84_010724 [Aphanomyces euteiches]|nr:hypothetical protein AeRB84_010724 [Aphanomyces euteiches]
MGVLTSLRSLSILNCNSGSIRCANQVSLSMGAAFSDYFTSPVDVSDGYYEDADPYVIIHHACAKGKHHVASMYFKKGGDPNERCFEDDDVYERDDTPMICAARGYPSEGIRGDQKKHILTLQIILLYGGDVNLYNKLHQTALYIAVTRGYVNIALWLLENGANPNICDSVGVSPLLCAARAGRVDLVALLLEYKADVQPPTRASTCLHFPTLASELKSFDPSIQSLLIEAGIPHDFLPNTKSRRSVASVAMMDALQGQLRALPPRSATPVVVAQPIDPFSREFKSSVVETKVVKPKSDTPSRSSVVDLNKCRSGGKWVKKREVSGRVHVAEWEFVKADFASDADRNTRPLVLQLLPLVLGDRQLLQLSSGPPQFQSIKLVSIERVSRNVFR